MHNIGETIRKLRTDKEWSQEALAEATGLNRSYIGSIERGKVTVGIPTLCKISSALSVTPGSIIEGEVVTIKEVKIHWTTFCSVLQKERKDIRNYLWKAGVKLI